MDIQKQKKLNARTKIIKALAHPTRLFLAEQLSRKEMCVCDLTEMVGVEISTVSKHLAILKAAGIVEAKKCGLQVCYRLKMTCAKKFLACIDQMIAVSV